MSWAPLNTLCAVRGGQVAARVHEDAACDLTTLRACRYILKGGYKAYHSAFPELCTPLGGYVRMVCYPTVQATSNHRREWSSRVLLNVFRRSNF